MRILCFVSFLCVLLFSIQTGSAQSADTIYTLRSEKIPCTVKEIGQVEIKYKKIENPDGPVYTILRERVRMISYANGYQEMIMPDDMDVHKEEPIADKKSIVKFEFFSPLSDQLSVGYERVWKPGMNLEGRIGFINNSMIPFSFSNGGNPNNGEPLTQGGFVKAGIKILLGSHTYVPGAKYRHPLHGFYFGLSLSQSVFIRHGLRFFYYPSPGPQSYIYTDQQVGSTSLHVNFGNQFILANKFTVGMGIGIGYAATYMRYTNPDVSKIISSYYYGYSENMSNLHSHVQPWGSDNPLSFTGTFTLGYILK